MKSRARDRFRFAGYEVTGTVVTKYIRVGNKTLAAKKVGDKLFYHNDHLGGVNVITDINGLVAQLIEYDPWGKISRSEGGGEGIIRFTGQKLDVESGLLYYGGRYYDPELGRFISPDPFVPEMFNPQSLNRYAYVTNNPVNYIDPSGYFHRHKKKDSGFFGTLFGAIFGFIFAGPAGAIFGAALAQLPSEVLHGLEIFGGIAMLLTGNPAGIAFMAQGALGFCKEQSCQYASAGFGLVGGAASFGAASSEGGGGSDGGGGGAPSGDFPIPQSPSLGGLGGLTLVNAGAGKGTARVPTSGSMRTVGDVVGKIWNAPNTAIGLLWGGIGLLGGADVSIGNNAIQFTNHPLMFGAITIGNTISYAPGFGPDFQQPYGTVGQHEMQHTIQGQVLGPLYLPSNILGGVAGLILNRSWGGSANWNEVGPYSTPPRPWP